MVTGIETFYADVARKSEFLCLTRQGEPRLRQGANLRLEKLDASLTSTREPSLVIN